MFNFIITIILLILAFAIFFYVIAKIIKNILETIDIEREKTKKFIEELNNDK